MVEIGDKCNLDIKSPTNIFSGEAYTYIGCYKDDANRDLVASTHLIHLNMTLRMCHEHCDDSYAYFGAQVG